MQQKTKNFAESYCLLNKSYYFCSVLSVTNIHANGKKVTQLNNLSNMLQSEFTMRTQIWCTTEQFEELHKMYMSSPLDKDAWCKQYKRKHELDITKAMVDEITSLKQELAAERSKREQEREHANKELLEALHKANAYAEELIRIYDIKGNDKAMHALFAKLQEKYNH
jgi:hypothetical protein